MNTIAESLRKKAKMPCYFDASGSFQCAADEIDRLEQQLAEANKPKSCKWKHFMGWIKAGCGDKAYFPKPYQHCPDCGGKVEVV